MIFGYSCFKYLYDPQIWRFRLICLSGWKLFGGTSDGEQSASLLTGLEGPKKFVAEILKLSEKPVVCRRAAHQGHDKFNQAPLKNRPYGTISRLDGFIYSGGQR